MLNVLPVLNTLLKQHTTWSYSIRSYSRYTDVEHYNIDLTVDSLHRLVVSDTPYPEYVEVWTNAHPTEEDGVRIKKSSLLEYILFILKEDFDI